MQSVTGLSASPHSYRRAYLLLAVVVLLWGANWPVMKVALNLVPPLWFTVLRLALGSGALFIAVAISGNLSRPGRLDVVQLLNGAVLQLAFYIGLINLGLRFVPAGRASVLAYTTPLWVVPGALLFLGERLDRLKATGLALGIAGLLVLFNPFAFDWSDGRVVAGNALLMAAACSWAASMLLVRGRPWHLTPFQLVPWQTLLAGLLILPAAIAFEGWPAVAPTPALAAVLAYSGPICTGFCIWAVVAITRALPAVTSSLAFLTVPVFGIAAATLTLGEPLDLALLAGLALILVGVALVARSDRRRALDRPSVKHSDALVRLGRSPHT
jgi:drug/metabolite transporter (DMT)-like permease